MKGITKLYKKVDKELVKFISVFLSLIALYYIFISLNISASFIEIVSSITAIKSVYILNLLDYNTNYLNNLIFSNNFSIRVGFGCEGTEPIALFLSAIIASRAKVKLKLLGGIVGTLILLLWNDIRVISLFIIGKNYNNYFDITHNDIFPFISLLLSIGMYLLWLKTIKKK